MLSSPSSKVVGGNNQKVKSLRQKETGDKLVGVKLLTEGQDLISFGKTKVVIGKLRVPTSGR